MERGLDKAPEAFRIISEVADELDVPQHVLRFWETRFSQIRPMKRSGGRRYYRPDDVDLLRGIRQLLYADGYTIRGVQRILREQGVRAVQGLARGEALTPGEPADEAPAQEATAMAPMPATAPLPEPDFGERREPVLTATRAAMASRAAGPAGAARDLAADLAADLAPDHRRQLVQLLSELRECRRMLAAARP